jgi:hypothetical protein
MTGEVTMSRIAQLGAAVIPVVIMLMVGVDGVSAQTPAHVRVVAKTADVLARPISGADVVVTAGQGTTLDVMDSDSGWYWVLVTPDSNGTRRRGWIHARDVEVVPALSIPPSAADLRPAPIRQEAEQAPRKQVAQTQSTMLPAPTQAAKDSVNSSGASGARKFDVKIINRQNNDKDYTYVVPGYSISTSNANANCYGNRNNANCNGSTNTTGINIPAQQMSYQVRGATFSLQLPDGRVAVVNCESKFKFGSGGRGRSCRIPLVDQIQAEFEGDKAKLLWSVSIDGTKMESETYKILAVLGSKG